MTRIQTSFDVAPDTPTEPAPPPDPWPCPTCGAATVPSEETGWRICENLHRHPVAEPDPEG